MTTRPLALWAISAILFATSDTPRSPCTLLRGPHLFPFDLPLPSITDLATCLALDISHHGLDREVLLAPYKQDVVSENHGASKIPSRTAPNGEHT